MVALIVLSPFINSILFMVASRYVHVSYLYSSVLLTMFASLMALLQRFPSVVSGDVASTSFGSWVYSGLFEVDWTFGMDSLTYVMLIVVLTVSTLVHLYSTEYMSEDPHLPRFISYLSLFTFFMLLLITSENLVSLFLGWEGVGLCSYLLISFWFTRVAANKAAIKAMVVNRVADLALTIGILATFFTFQTVEFSVLFGLAPFVPLSAITLLLFIGAMGKSAQIGLHTWLPDAMEGPTPVSALIHAATMVTAGVFLIIRCSALFERTPDVLLFVTFIGAATAFMAATSGLLQNDLKKIIAYSTCSQLGYMVFICGLSGYAISFFHLANHAFFKALLFLSAGAVIHALSSEQDLRRLGSLLPLLPYTYIMFLIGSLALMGFPFLTGFYSKDLILEVAASSLTLAGTFAYSLGLITALFTAFYSFRLLYLAFYSTSRSPRVYLAHAHELTPRMAFSLAVLALGSIFFGFLGRDLFIGLGTAFWNGVIPTTPLAQLSGEFLSVFVKLAPLMGSMISVFAVFFLTGTLNRSLHRFLSHKWYFDTVYNQFINQPLLQAAYRDIFKPVDKGVLELAGPTGLGRLAVRLGRFISLAQTGRVYDYAVVMFGALLVYVASAEAWMVLPLYSFHRLGYYGTRHFLIWTRPAVLKLTAKVLLLLVTPPVLVGLAIMYFKQPYIFCELVDIFGMYEALRLNVASILLWPLAALFMFPAVALREAALQKRLINPIAQPSRLPLFISYLLSFSFIPLTMTVTAATLSVYAANRAQSQIMYRWKSYVKEINDMRADCQTAVDCYCLPDVKPLKAALRIQVGDAPFSKNPFWGSVPSDYLQVIRPFFDGFTFFQGTIALLLIIYFLIYLAHELPTVVHASFMELEWPFDISEWLGAGMLTLLMFYWGYAASILYDRITWVIEVEVSCQPYLRWVFEFAAEKREHIAQLKDASALAQAAFAENIAYWEPVRIDTWKWYINRAVFEVGCKVVECFKGEGYCWKGPYDDDLNPIRYNKHTKLKREYFVILYLPEEYC